MDDQELLKERFKSAVSSAVKAISENFDLEIKFGNNKDKAEKNIVGQLLILFKFLDNLNTADVSINPGKGYEYLYSEKDSAEKISFPSKLQHVFHRLLVKQWYLV